MLEFSNVSLIGAAANVSSMPLMVHVYLEGIGRMLLDHPLPGWPEPQVVDSQSGKWRTHRAIVHVFSGEETSPVVSQMPFGSTTTRLHVLIGRFPPVSCWVHGEPFSCSAPLAPDVDHIRVLESDTDVFDTRLAGLDAPVDVPRNHFLQPAYRSHFLARGYIPAHGFPRAARGQTFVVQEVLTPDPSTDGTFSSSSEEHHSASEDPAPEVMSFTVFDVYRHVRVLTTELPASRRSLLQAVLDATPEMRAPIGHRILRDPLGGFPTPQIVVWQEPSAGERVIPVLHSEVEGAICTVAAPVDSCPYQLAWIVEGACATPPPCRHAIARQQAHFSLDGISYPPFVSCDLSGVDSAVYASGPHNTFRMAAARWARRVPGSLVIARHSDFTDEPAGDLVFLTTMSLGVCVHCFVPSSAVRPFAILACRASVLRCPASLCTWLPLIRQLRPRSTLLFLTSDVSARKGDPALF